MTTIIAALDHKSLFTVLCQYHEKKIELADDQLAQLKAELATRDKTPQAALDYLGMEKYALALRDKTSLWHELLTKDVLAQTLLKSIVTDAGKIKIKGGYEHTNQYDKNDPQTAHWYLNLEVADLTQAGNKVHTHLEIARECDIALNETVVEQLAAVIGRLAVTFGDIKTRFEDDRRLGDNVDYELARTIKNKADRDYDWDPILNSTLTVFDKLVAYKVLTDSQGFCNACHIFSQSALAPRAMKPNLDQRSRIKRSLNHPFIKVRAQALEAEQAARALLDEAKKAEGSAVVDAFAAAVNSAVVAREKLAPLYPDRLDKLNDTITQQGNAVMERLVSVAIGDPTHEKDAMLTEALKLDLALATVFLSRLATSQDFRQLTKFSIALTPAG